MLQRDLAEPGARAQTLHHRDPIRPEDVDDTLLEEEHLLPDLARDHDVVVLQERLRLEHLDDAEDEALGSRVEEGNSSHELLSVVHGELAAEASRDVSQHLPLVRTSLRHPPQLHVLPHSLPQLQRHFAPSHVVVEPLDLSHVSHSLRVHLHEQADADGDERRVEHGARQGADHREDVFRVRRSGRLVVSAHERDGRSQPS
eukprot:544595-Hanusia_phi.AAC.1